MSGSWAWVKPRSRYIGQKSKLSGLRWWCGSFRAMRSWQEWTGVIRPGYWLLRYLWGCLSKYGHGSDSSFWLKFTRNSFQPPESFLWLHLLMVLFLHQPQASCLPKCWADMYSYDLKTGDVIIPLRKWSEWTRVFKPRNLWQCPSLPCFL